MHRFILVANLVAWGILVNCGPLVQAAEKPNEAAKPDAKLRLSRPYTHDNLTIFFVHGPETMAGRKLLTLAEALDQKKVAVVETSNVNQLTVENKGDVDVFIMSGDIVKGGKQDRVMGYDLLLTANSGPTPILSFCVEHGRWQRRGTEDAAVFSSSKNVAAGKPLKNAISGSRNQAEVWDKVAESQKKLSSNVGKSVNNPTSASSLQLSLEDKDLQEKVAAYEKDLADAVTKEEGAIGMVIAVNGKLSGADVYGSKDLFRKVWERQLKSAATEALSEWKKDQKFEAVAATVADAFLASATDTERKEEKLSESPPMGQNASRAGRRQANSPAPAKPTPTDKAGNSKALPLPVRLYRYEKTDSLVLECQDSAKPDQILHRMYLAK